MTTSYRNAIRMLLVGFKCQSLARQLPSEAPCTMGNICVSGLYTLRGEVVRLS